METSFLIKLSLCCAFFGLFFLYLFSLNQDIIKESNELPEEKLILKGIILSIYQKNNVAFIKLAETKTSQIVVFTNQNLPLSKGNIIEVVGKKQNYNNKEEIIAERIRKIS